MTGFNDSHGPRRPHGVSSLIAAVAFCAMCALPASVAAMGAFPPEKMIGEWQGAGRIVVTWCTQDYLPIHIFVRADGRVSGAIGNALIDEGRVRKNNWFLDWLGNPEYVIEADLDGFLIEAEGIRRKSIELTLDLQEHELVGGFQSSGDKTGGKESMAMSGTSVRLSRVQRLDTEVGQIRARQFIGEETIGDWQVCRIRFGEKHSFAHDAQYHNKTQVRGEIRRRMRDLPSSRYDQSHQLGQPAVDVPGRFGKPRLTV